MEPQVAYGAGQSSHRSSGWKKTGIIFIILFLLAGCAAGGLGFLYIRAESNVRSKNDEIAKRDSTVKDLQAQVAKLETAAKTPQDGVDGEYFTIKAWNIKFKIPAGLADIQYSIQDDVAYIIAMPSDTSIKYVDGVEKNVKQYALGTIQRSEKSVIEKLPGSNVDGKKMGQYYYYTGWSFSALATGAGITGIYGEGETAMQVESKVFNLINQTMLPTIELIDPTK
jgi:outer membrane murein-binding lipoprotein Lpp